ncbi:MAG: hypothetical protein AABX93_02185 [Nanoarchaeota archaeon]
MQMKSKTVKQYASFALSASSQLQSQEIVPTRGDIIGFDFNLTVDSVGTLVTPTKVTAAIEKLLIADKSGKPLIDCAGTDLPFIALLLSPHGSYDAPADNSTSSPVWNDLLALTGKLEDQPLFIQVTFAPYSALAASGTTGATVDFTIGVWYGQATQTLRVYKKVITGVVGDNYVDNVLNNGKITQSLSFRVGTESNLTSVTFSPTGATDDYQALLKQQIIDLENDAYKDEHQTGLFNLFVEPFEFSTANSSVDIVLSGTDTITVYQIATN